MNDSTKHIVAIIQARMDSSRLPGKVLQPIASRPMLGWVIERASRSKLVDQVAVATTSDASDDAVTDFCRQFGCPCYRGSTYDVLDRFYQAARSLDAEYVVRLTADCPFIDPDEIDRVVQTMLAGHYDFVANRLPPPAGRTFPIGLDTEACSFEVLEQAWKNAVKPHQREHVMPYLYENEGEFRITVLQYAQDYGHIRITVDTTQDLELVRSINRHFEGRDDFNWLEIVRLLESHPELFAINAGVQHKSGIDIDSRMISGNSGT